MDKNFALKAVHSYHVILALSNMYFNHREDDRKLDVVISCVRV